MAVTIKSSREIELMREAGKILAKTHEELERALKPGMSTLDIDRIGEEIIRSYGCIPSFKNYNGYPASICVSVNDEVVHGIPTKKHIIQAVSYTHLTVRGSVMNPNDHPHGGGEGKTGIGRPGPSTPWGKPALGLKTRKKHKQSNKLIVRRRDGKTIK